MLCTRNSAEISIQPTRDEESLNQLRILHVEFIKNIHKTSLCFFICTVIQWTLCVQSKSFVYYLKRYHHICLAALLIAFALMLVFIFFVKMIAETKMRFYLYTITMAQIGTAAVLLPATDASVTDTLYTMIMVTVIVGVSVFLSLNTQDEFMRSSQYNVTCTVRIFVLSSIGIVLSATTQNPYFDICLSLAGLFFIAIHIMNFGKSIGSTEFFESDKCGTKLLGVLHYYNIIVLYSVGLLFFERVRTSPGP